MAPSTKHATVLLLLLLVSRYYHWFGFYDTPRCSGLIKVPRVRVRLISLTLTLTLGFYFSLF